MYRALENDWVNAVTQEDYEGSLCQFAWETLHRLEADEKYEACKGLLLTIDEYADALRC